MGWLQASTTFAIFTRLWRSLTPNKAQGGAILALTVSVLLLGLPSRGQTFKAVPLDCGGWFSGFAQADNGRLYGYGDVFGAWRSDNGGTSWSYLNWSIPGGDVGGLGMAVQKNNADVVYYSTGDKLYKSTNGGTNWTVLLSDIGDNTPRFRGTSPILIRSNDPNEIWFAGPRKNKQGWLWKSSNGGTDWVKAGGSNFDSNRARTLHNVSAFANQIWVGSDNGLYVSTDGGNNFSLVGGSGRLSEVGMIARFTTGTFAGVGLVTRSNGGGGGISRITASNYNDATTYAVSDAATNSIYFGYPTGLQIFSDGSSSAWNTSADRHGFSPAGNGGQLFTVRSTTLNTSVVPIWTTAAEMAAKNHPDYGTDQVIEAVGNPNKWMITGGGAPMYSLDKGLSWQYFPNGSGLAAVKAYFPGISRHDANRVYVPASDIGSAIVTDGGNSGQATLSSHKSFTSLHSAFRILEGPDTQNLVLAGVDQGTNSTLLLRSTNGGSNWDVVPQSGNGLPPSRDGVTKAVMSFTDANDFLVVLASGTGQGGPITPGTINPGVWRTTNGGASFTQVQDLPRTGLSTGHRYDPQSCFIERDAVQPDVRYFVSRDAPFYRSTNGGTNWTPRTHPFAKPDGGAFWAWDFHADPVRGGNLWAAGDFAGVKVSRDGGQTWNPTAQYMNARLVSSCNGKIAVFGSMAGDAQPRLYYSSDDGATFTALTSPSYNFHSVQGLAVDRSGKVWVSWNSVTVVTPSTLTSAQAAIAPTASAVQVYPNPAAGSFSVTTGKEGAMITVRTLAGKLMSTVKANSQLTTIDAGSWPAGMYFIQVQAGAETTVKKLVIAK
ncbi:T9SS type A sorting domain-containing protein [Hymenobacter sp. BT664]|uniref:T9SS type A sorting domain-containing protein n=1 Tax=Hymenobacter montanus TaxID=2771359 RepID=A0A927GJC4_9BACT|nr:T9SS type A sorting domain-containing protein [Hymenobacter montanus]MBD2768009.1 T9SS type A sorting domain-containing protein [Hymenobacter montanus]